MGPARLNARQLLIVQHETSERTRTALMRISPRCRYMLEALFFEDDTSYTELAARLGCSPNSIGPIRGRCFKELRDALTRGGAS